MSIHLRKSVGPGGDVNVNDRLIRTPVKRACHLATLCIMVATSAAASTKALRDGDIIFQTSQSSQSIAIQRATASPYSHMGVIFFRHGRPYVLEASATVRYTPLD